MIAIYPGSFDPLTDGHLNIIHRAANLFEELVVVVAYNPAKRTMFSVEERTRLVREAVTGLHNVRVDSFSSRLLVDYARQQRVDVIVKGLRNVNDFQNEFQQYNMNHEMLPALETIFFLADSDEIFVSSTLVRDMIREHGEYQLFVPAPVEEEVEGGQ